MSWLEFIEKVIGHVVWPGAAIAILLILRRHLSGIFVALKSLKLPGGVELELYDRFRELREQAEAAELPIPETAPQVNDEDRKFLQMAEDFPQAAIMQTWIELEKEMLITRKPQLVLGGDRALVWFGRQPKSGAQSWLQDRIAC